MHRFWGTPAAHAIYVPRFGKETAQLWLSVWLAWAAVGCTPIAAVNGKGRPDDAGTTADGSTGVARTTDDSKAQRGTPEGAAGSAIATASAPCAANGVHACGGQGVRDVYICRDGSWRAETPCQTSERCQTAAGLDQGTCQPMAAECSGQMPGVLFCDGDMRIVCDDLITSRVVPCGNLLRCMPSKTESAGCSCMMGAFDPGDGKGCQIATSCTTGGGGCDPLTQCSMDATGKPSCSVCPPPYIGEGSMGCIPQLMTLTPSCGKLTPALTSGVYEYRLKVPLSCQSLQLTAEVPPSTVLAIEGIPVGSGSNWRSELLQVGENAFKVAVTAASGKNSSYQLTVERDGVETDFIKASNARAGDGFGFSVAADGDTMVVGAPYEDGASSGVNGDQDNTGAADSGAAYVFVRQANAWVQQGYFKADAPAANDHFGSSVAISKDTIIVGAPRSDPAGWGVTSPTNQGVAYAYVRTGQTWSLEGKLEPATPNARPDLFGISVSVDQDTALAGAPDESNTMLGAGAVYAFTRSNGSWTFAQRVEPDKPFIPAAFGFSVAIQGDTFVAGSPQDARFERAAGSAYVFGRLGGKWHEVQHLEPVEPVEQATFGLMVAISGTRAVVSAAGLDLLQRPTPPGNVYLYDIVAGTWVQNAVFKRADPFSIDLFGGSVALSEDALFFGSNGDSSASRGPNGDPTNKDAWRSGAAYVFGQQPDMRWEQSAYLKASNADRDDAYAQSVAVVPGLFMVGAPSESSASKGFGGDPSSNAAANSGAVYVYR